MFTHFPWQERPWHDTSEVMLLYGGSGSGKSALAAQKIHALCMRYPNSTALMLRKMRETMSNSTVLYFESVVTAGNPHVKHHKSMHRFEYDNGSIVAYGGMKDQAQREGIRSIGSQGGVDWAWLEEANAFTWIDYEKLLTRMRGQAALNAVGRNFTQVILTTNPDSDTHWINKKLIEEKRASSYFARPEDNPKATQEYINKLRNLTGVRSRRMYEGKWEAAEGVIFDDFDRNHHIIPRFPIPDDWRKFRVVDFGFVHAFCCQWWAVDPDGCMYRYREIYKTRTLVEDHAKKMRELSMHELIDDTICDHDAEDRATLERHGIPTKAAYKAVERGIQNVQARMRPKFDAEGRPKPRSARIYFLDGSL